MLNWLHLNQMSVFGFMCMLGAILNSGTSSVVYFVGALLCWGVQELLDEKRSPTHDSSQEKEDV